MTKLFYLGLVAGLVNGLMVGSYVEQALAAEEKPAIMASAPVDVRIAHMVQILDKMQLPIAEQRKDPIASLIERVK